MEPLSPHSVSRAFKTFQDLLEMIAAALPVEEVCTALVTAAARLTAAEVCTLWVTDDRLQPPQLVLRATQCTDAAYRSARRLPLDGSLSGEVIAGGHPVVIEDIHAAPAFRDKALAQRLGLVALMSIPVPGDGQRPRGVLNCFAGAARRFTPEDMLQAGILAGLAAAALRLAAQQGRIADLDEELETRKRVERAKEILMRQRNLTGEQAYRWIQKRSMDSRRSMREVAEMVVLSEELGYYSSIPHSVAPPPKDSR
jgi:GAF domain-containing protein